MHRGQLLANLICFRAITKYFSDKATANLNKVKVI